jgi:hypothetical protein
MTPSLPVTVESVKRRRNGLWLVTLTMADGTVRQVFVPDSVATVKHVQISAQAYAVLMDAQDTRKYPRRD